MGQTASFTNQHVVITGGTQGLGLHLAGQFAKDGARVTVISRNPAHLEDAKAFMESQGGSMVQGLSADATDAAQLTSAINQAAGKFGPVDVLVTCAGFAPTGNLFWPQPASPNVTQALFRNAPHPMKGVWVCFAGPPHACTHALHANTPGTPHMYTCTFGFADSTIPQKGVHQS